MQKHRWKSIAVTIGLSAGVALMPQSVLASWPNYSLYEIAGAPRLNNAALAVNSYNRVCGLQNYDTNTQDFTGLLGGVNENSSFYYLPNNWNTMQLNSLNSEGATVGTVWIGVHPTAVYYVPGSPAQNMQVGLNYTYQSIGNGINHAGIAVGSYNREEEYGPVTHMFRWDPVSQTRTGDWPNLIPGGINENGLMAAQNDKPTNYYGLPELALVPATGSPTFVVAPGFYTYMQPNAVSTSGGPTVVGDMMSYIENDSDSFTNGFVYNQTANAWQVLPGVVDQYFETHGLGVDVWGDKAVGYTVDQNGVQTATVWENDGGTWNPTALSSLLPADGTWKYNQATGISPEGAISGIGMHKENRLWVQRGFVAVPSGLIRLVVREGGIYGGEIVASTVHLQAMDPFTLSVGLQSDSRLVDVPGGVRIPAMESDAEFTMQTMGVDRDTHVKVTANLGGFSTISDYLLLPAVLQALTLNTANGAPDGMVTLRGQAGPSGTQVSLTSSNPMVTVPKFIRVDKGNSTAPFRIGIGTGVTEGTVVTITATQGNVTMSQQFTVP